MPAASNATALRHADAGKVLVLGAGVAGIRAALELAELGIAVLLVDATPAIGGLLTKLDHQFPNNHCGMCRILPEVGSELSSNVCLRKGLFHDNIDILPDTTLRGLSGEPGAFRLQLHRRARWIDNSLCSACPAPCIDACPVTVPDEFNHALTQRKAIHRPTPLGLPDTLHIDSGSCTRCGECVEVCPANAIDLDLQDETLDVETDAVIVAVGSSLFRPADHAAAKHLRSSPNIVTALDFERLLSVAGRRRTGLLRPSDGRPIRRVAWLQCVGSRDRKHGRDVCSSVCCMFALKEASLVRAIGDGAIDTSIYYMDIRGCGKASQRAVRSAEHAGVRLVRSRVHDIAATADGSVAIRTILDGARALETDRVDLLVLSNGQRANEHAASLARIFGWELSPEGFAPAMPGEPVKSPVPGVFLCGSMTGPADIADSIVSATAAASEAHKLLAQLGRPTTARADTPPPRQGADAKLIVLACECHHERDPRELGPVALHDALGAEVLSVKAPCLPEGAAEAEAILEASGVDRVVFAACSPHAYRRALEGVARRAGIHPALVKVVDARQDVRSMRATVAALQSAEPSPQSAVTVEPRVLVVGGGIAGLRAALSLAQRGVDVDLVEAAEFLGGRFASHRGHAWDGVEPAALAAMFSKQATDNPRIAVHLGARVTSSAPGIGHHDTVVREKSGADRIIRHGATILTTGAHGALTSSYAHGTCERILTQEELEARLEQGPLSPAAREVIVMIQCVDAREQNAHDYCSRICCARALANAKALQSVQPSARIFILYRDMMTPGLWERDYTAARKSGISFTPYELAHRPEVRVAAGRPVVRVLDPVLDRILEISADWLILSTGIEPDRSNAGLASIFGVDLNPDGFFQEADAKWRPVDFTADGVFVAGTAHGPQAVRDVVAQAEAAAHRAFSFLSRRVAFSTGEIADVHHALCSRCGACIVACAHRARRLDATDDRIEVDPLRCRGCGVCTAACPNGATRLGVMGERQIIAALDAALEDVTFPSARHPGGPV